MTWNDLLNDGDENDVGHAVENAHCRHTHNRACQSSIRNERYRDGLEDRHSKGKRSPVGYVSQHACHNSAKQSPGAKGGQDCAIAAGASRERTMCQRW